MILKLIGSIVAENAWTWVANRLPDHIVTARYRKQTAGKINWIDPKDPSWERWGFDPKGGVELGRSTTPGKSSAAGVHVAMVAGKRDLYAARLAENSVWLSKEVNRLHREIGQFADQLEAWAKENRPKRPTPGWCATVLRGILQPQSERELANGR